MRAAPSAVPVFGLYGDPANAIDPGFVAAELISQTAPLHNWHIKSHRHRNLSQALLVLEGGGRLNLDATHRTFEVPWLVWVPAGVVHGYSFEPGTEGFVISISDDFLSSATAAHPDAARLRALSEIVLCEPLPPAERIDIDLKATCEALTRETASALPGARIAVTGLLLILLVGLGRAVASHSLAQPQLAQRTNLYRRFRALVEAHLREHRPISSYAAALNITTDRLHAVCTEATGQTPQGIVHDRLVLEAKRDLAYTWNSVSEVAFGLGFNDTAYFSRFFSKRVGISPAAYRKKMRVEAEV